MDGREVAYTGLLGVLETHGLAVGEMTKRDKPQPFCSCADRILCDHHKRVIDRLLTLTQQAPKPKAQPMTREYAMQRHPAVLR